MSIPIPNLDDRKFQDLIDEARALIPVYNKEWTNHNITDPGITLLELFAWLTEMMIYRINKVPEENYLKFLKLLGKNVKPSGNLESDIREVLKQFSQRHRAITSEDYEFLALQCMEDLQAGLAGRAICINNRDLEFSRPDKEKPGHLSVIIIPNALAESDYLTSDNLATGGLIGEVKAYLDDRRLITSRIHVVRPFFKEIRLQAWIALKENTDEDKVKNDALKKVSDYFDPVSGGPEKSGWPLGRDLYRSELYHLIESISGVDHVEKILLNNEEVNSIEIKENEIILLEPAPVIQTIEEGK